MFAYQKPCAAFALSTLSLCFPLSLFAEPLDVYGRINVSVQQSDEGAGAFSELKSNSSRFGLRGDQALEQGLTVIYRLEWEVDPSDEANERNIRSRDQFIGLRGSYGTIKAGRIDSALKLAQGNVDQFSDYEADIRALWRGENRTSNTLMYISPSFQGFSAQLSHVMADTPNGVDGQSVALIYGDEDLEDSQVFGSIALDNDINGFDNQRLMLQTRWQGVIVGAGVHQQQAVVSGQKDDGYVLSVAHQWQQIEFKAQYQTLSDDNAISVGADYRIGEQTKLYAWYSSFDLTTRVDSDYIAIGLEHRFE